MELSPGPSYWRTAALALLLLAGTVPAAAQDCKMLFCAPTLQLESGVSVTDLFDPARVRPLPNGPAVELETKTHFQLALSLEIPSTLPRTDFLLEMSWLPFAADDRNTFTGYTASELADADDVEANLPALQWGASFLLLKPETVGGWVGVDLNVLDQFSPAAEPEDAREYTHKLNLELDATLHAFNWLPKGSWFRNLAVSATLDYLVTGLPDEGDEVPKNERVFLDDASPWSFSAALVVPIAPIAPQP